MTYSKISSCPHCGAPIYAPTIWNSITPPPITYSCNCTNQSNQSWHTNTCNPGFLPPPPPLMPIKIPKISQKETIDNQKAIEELLKAFEEVKKSNFSETTKDPIKSLYDAFEENAMLKRPVTNDDIMKKLNKLEKDISLILEKLKT